MTACIDTQDERKDILTRNRGIHPVGGASCRRFRSTAFQIPPQPVRSARAHTRGHSFSPHLTSVLAFLLTCSLEGRRAYLFNIHGLTFFLSSTFLPFPDRYGIATHCARQVWVLRCARCCSPLPRNLEEMATATGCKISQI